MAKTLEDQISGNRIKSYLLVLFVPIIFLMALLGIGLAWGAPNSVLVLGTIVVILYTVYANYCGHKIVLAATGAVKADPSADRHLINIVDGLRIGSGTPMPEVYIQNSPDINAFAAGRDPEHAIVCVTTGAVKQLTKAELEGVLAHEMAHIKNYDVRFMTVVAALVGAIALVSQIFLRSLWFGSHDRDRNGAGIVFLLVGLLLAILAPIAATLVQLAISRRREYLADASGAHISRNPKGLADALQKIADFNKGRMKVSGAVAPLYIASPKVSELFSTHPPIEERIKRLREM